MGASQRTFTRSVIRGWLSRPLVPIVTIQRDGYG